MDSYDKRALNIADVIAALSISFGLIGWWLTRQHLFINISFIALGINSVYFNHALAMERVVKFKLNYKFLRRMHVFVGFVFIVINIVLLVVAQ